MELLNKAADAPRMFGLGEEHLMLTFLEEYMDYFSDQLKKGDYDILKKLFYKEECNTFQDWGVLTEIIG
jgi:hypothetical protein